MSDVIIADLPIEGVKDTELEIAFRSVLVEHKEAIASIHKSMIEADEAYRKYLDPDFEPDEQEAKKDRATLNKCEKSIQEDFSGLKAAYEKPLSPLEANIKSIRTAIKEASGVVDSSAKRYEEKRKGKKRNEIEEYFISKKFELVPFDRILDERWLNKTYKMTDIRKELDAKIAEIYQCVKTLEMIPEYGLTAKALYLETLEIGAALARVETLKANAEKLAKEKIEREEREHAEAVQLNIKEQRKEAREENRKAYLDFIVTGAMPEERPKLYEMTLKFIGTEDALKRLKEWMSMNEISYEKISYQAAELILEMV